MDDRDYLQDPEMWEDKLPQPYKTINKILRGILQEAWVRIEEREVTRKREAAQVRIPSGAAGVVLGGSILENVCGGIQCGNDSLLVVGNGTSVCAVKYYWTDSESVKQKSDHSTIGSADSIAGDCDKNLHAEIITELNLKHKIIRLAAMQQEDVLVIFVQLEKGKY